MFSKPKTVLESPTKTFDCAALEVTSIGPKRVVINITTTSQPQVSLSYSISLSSSNHSKHVKVVEETDGKTLRFLVDSTAVADLKGKVRVEIKVPEKYRNFRLSGSIDQGRIQMQSMKHVLGPVNLDVREGASFKYQNQAIVIKLGEDTGIVMNDSVATSLCLNAQSGIVIKNVSVIDENEQYSQMKLTSTSGSIKIDCAECSSADICSTSGNIKVNDLSIHGSGTSGELTITTTSGDVTAKTILAGKVDIQCQSGDVKLEAVDVRGSGSGYDGPISVQTTSGGITASAINAGETTLLSSSGTHRITNLDAGKVELKSSSGNIKVFSSNVASLQTESKSGDVELKAVILATSVSAITTSGNITAEVDGSSSGCAEKGITATFTSNSGDQKCQVRNFSKVQAQTTSGSSKHSLYPSDLSQTSILTVSGNARVGMFGFAGEWEAKSVTGDLSVPEDYQVFGSKERRFGVHGKGSGRVSVESSSGDIKLEL